METSGSAQALLRVSKLEHSFIEGEGKVHALRGVSLEARAGEVTAIVGPSGCGKSTLLYLLGLLDRPDQGEIRLEESVAQASDEIRLSAKSKDRVVFQFHFLIKELTVCESVALPLRQAGLSEKDASDRAAEVLRKLGLGDKCERCQQTIRR